MSHRRDHWRKPHSTSDHLAESEIARIRAAFRADVPAKNIAQDLQCSTRTVQKYYAMFGGRLAAASSGKPREPLAAEPERSAPHPPATRPSRFYKGNFEL